jgi:outer membrane protein TolC
MYWLANLVFAGDVSQSPVAAPSLDQIVSEVLSNNPSLKAARATWEGMKQRVPQARAWEDLKVGVGVERSGTPRFNTVTDAEWMVAQSIPLSGKNRKRAQAAAAEAGATFEELRRLELNLTAQARAAFYRLANAYEQLDLNWKNVQLLQQFVEITRAKYAVGTQMQGDVLLAETDLAKQEETRFDIEREISDAESRLNVLRNRPASESVSRPAPSALAGHGADPRHLPTLALAHAPDLRIAQQKIQAAQARYDLARREWIPDPELRVEARQFNGSGADFREYDTGIFFSVPWLNRKKYKAAVEEAKMNLETARRESEAKQQEMLGRLRDHLKRIETFHHHTELFRTKIVPLAQQNVSATRLSYETDKTGFLNLLQAQRNLREVESMYWHHLTEYRVALAELEMIVGTDPKLAPESRLHHEKGTP